MDYFVAFVSLTRLAMTGGARIALCESMIRLAMTNRICDSPPKFTKILQNPVCCSYIALL
ncbi:hypothetical protein ACWIUD_08870 [Helicobacter sp. 23-1044]